MLKIYLLHKHTEFELKIKNILSIFLRGVLKDQNFEIKNFKARQNP